MAKAMSEYPLTHTPPESSDDEVEDKWHAEDQTRLAGAIPVQPTSTPTITDDEMEDCFLVEDYDVNNPNLNEPQPPTPSADYSNPNILAA